MKKIFMTLIIIIITSGCSILPTPTPIIKEIPVTLEVPITVEVTKVVEVTKEFVITATPEPTLTPSPTIPPTFKENFEGGIGEWLLSSNANETSEIKNGKLYIWLTKNRYLDVGNPELDGLISGSNISLDIEFISGSRESWAGIKFRMHDNGDFVSLYISGNGYYTFGLQQAKQGYTFINPTKLPALDRNNNNLRLVDNGTRILAYANNELLFDFPYEYLPLGNIAISVFSSPSGEATWAFDNLEVRQLP